MPHPRSRSSQAPRRAAWLILAVWLGALHCSLGAQNNEFETIIARYRQVILHSNPHWSSDTAPAPDRRQLEHWIATLNPAGSWPDINYEDQDRASWKTTEHLHRTRKLAVAWAGPDSPLHSNPAAEAAVLKSLDFWLAKGFKNPNWWWNQIGAPGATCDIVVMVDRKLTGKRRADALRVFAQCGRPVRGSGANTIWIADLALQYGAITTNAALVRLCAEVLADEIEITDGEGIQSDYSFHQHSARLQQFSYGRAFLLTAARMAWQLQETEWRLPEIKAELLANLALEGDQWMCRGPNTVPSTLDRHVSRPGALKWADVRLAAEQLCDILPERRAVLSEFLGRQNGTTPPLTGARYFPRSDFLVVHRSKFSFFLKMLSSRTLPTEVGLNSENLKGVLQNCGDHYLVADGREYFDLAPVWNWDLLPGVTFAEGSGTPQRRAFVGAIANSDSAVAVMDCAFGGLANTNLSVKQFWACHGDVMVCLLADLSASGGTNPVRTAMDQCRSRGPVTVCDERGVERKLAGNARGLKVRWVHHAGFAYAPLEGLPVSVQAGTTTGSWHAINNGLPEKSVTESVFLATLEHGAGPVHATGGYAVAAGSAAECGKLLRAAPWRVLRNDAAAQVVVFADGALMAAFHEPGKIEGKGAISVNRPCLVLTRDGKTWISDPTQTGGRARVRLGEKLHEVELPAGGHALALAK